MLSRIGVESLCHEIRNYGAQFPCTGKLTNTNAVFLTKSVIALTKSVLNNFRIIQKCIHLVCSRQIKRSISHFRCRIGTLELVYSQLAYWTVSLDLGASRSVTVLPTIMRVIFMGFPNYTFPSRGKSTYIAVIIFSIIMAQCELCSQFKEDFSTGKKDVAKL